jgi:hypothetical protein
VRRDQSPRLRGNNVPQTNFGEREPRHPPKGSRVDPTRDGARGKELCIGVEIQGTSYEFIIDTGADVCLVQPYVEDEPMKEIGDAVKGIT